MRALKVLPLVLALLTISCLSTLAQAERRTALVIGNGAYKTAPLKNPTNDAQDMASALREMGFDVTLKVNVNHRDMEEAVRSFGVKLKQGGLGLFYYAGHGVQVGGENYLIPVDTKVDAEADVKFGALNAGMVLARMEDAGNGLNMVILDACRTNPFARSFRTSEQGLARMDAPKGSLIAYATAPGRVAADSVGSGRNGVYTGFLLQHMRTPGLKVEEALKRVRADVVRVTKDKQIPWESSSLIGDLYFALPGTASSMVALPKVPPDTTYASLEIAQPPAPSKTNNPNTKGDELYARGSAALKRKDYSTALTLFHKAAEMGHAKAQSNLGILYFSGEGVQKDVNEGILWLKKSAEQGLVKEQVLLGTIYYEGKAISQDYDKALHYFRLASDKSNDDAQYNLGFMIENGFGVPQNKEEAIALYRKSALLGNVKAQVRLGAKYALGIDVAQDYALAYMWLHFASAQGNENASKSKNFVASQMTTAQLEQAAQMIRELKATQSRQNRL